ncbi:arylamine N-acetyltransferase 1 [Rhineura floridana]|uniref:arylamine N-acetyltransferase 1 n=1 Tax=Rhineura floridana TaxID=261503 RepID=UPI002AC7F626|nr:arylamine N-acetyltransferase 1 [Rhineura floridana]XP_061450229.1 arylamine N-acetyltransferase 1 [Rhineura floridana]XP_061450230.1 arylamine N-acetyltransferase 1 [Rhineura floridana]XP_061450232.1 arylamine N-acetyltransferase 1 [Rhineura floridana]
MNTEEYFTRIGYKGSLEKLDFETLTAIFQHHIRAVPFENLSIHCGETITLDLGQVYNKIVKKKRGGWCMENNQLLSWVLKNLGYNTTILGAYVYNPQQNVYATHMTHLIIKVVIDRTAYIVDAGFGVSYQMWQPLELVSGKHQPQTPGIFRFTEDNGIWYYEKIRRKQHIPNQNFSSSDLLEKKTRRNIYSFSLEPRTVEDFQFQCSYLQTSPDSPFTKKSICTLQTNDGFRALIGWTLSETQYKYEEDMDLVEFTMLSDDEVEKTLREKFGITLENKLVPIDIKGLYTI